MNQESDKTNQGISMLKNCLKSLFLFLLPVMGFAQIGSLSYEDFVHLSEKDQDRFVIKTMELIVRLENAHRNDPRTMHFSEEDEKKFSLFLKQLKGTLFIDEAHAYPGNDSADREWNKAANDFKELITKDSDKKKCVYAGWISKAIGEGSNVTCAHPGYLMGDKSKKNQTPEGRAYIAPSSGSSCDQGGIKKIQCSPVIFGYKSIKDKTPFCVSAENMARNSSFDCMQAALDLDEKNKGDTKKDRLDYIKSRLTDPMNKDVFKQVHEFNYKMCVCDSKPIPANFSNDYLKEIQLHQTCYGMMKMIGETSKHCGTQSLPSGMDLTIFEQLDNYINPLKNQSIDSNKVPSNVYGTWYKNYITKLRSNKTPEYVRLCGGKVAPKPKPTEEPVIICKGTCEIDKPEKGKMQCELSIKKDKNHEEKITQQFSTADYTDDGLKTRKKPLMIKVEELSKKEITCEIGKPSGSEMLCILSIKKDNEPEINKTQSFTMAEYTDDGLETQKNPLMIRPENSTKEINCEITANIVKQDPGPKPQPNEPKDPKKPKTYTCEASCVADNKPEEGGKKCDLTITSNDGSVKEVTTTKNKTFKKGEALEFKPEGAEKAVSCTEIKPDDPKDEPKEDTSKPTIKVTAIEGKETYKVKAVKENDEGWTFGWAIKGEKDVDVSGVSKDWEKKTEEAPKGVANDGTASPEVSLAPDEFLQKRGKVDFKICGQLTKNKEVIEDCALIKKLEESQKTVTPPVVGPQGNNTPAAPPQPMIRRSSDASAVGIR